jgi:hypothetical protein
MLDHFKATTKFASYYLLSYSALSQCDYSFAAKALDDG